MLWYSASLSTLAGQNSNNSQHWQTLKSLFSSESPSYSLPDFREFLSMHIELNIQPKTQGDPTHILELLPLYRSYSILQLPATSAVPQSGMFLHPARWLLSVWTHFPVPCFVKSLHC